GHGRAALRLDRGWRSGVSLGLLGYRQGIGATSSVSRRIAVSRASEGPGPTAPLPLTPRNPLSTGPRTPPLTRPLLAADLSHAGRGGWSRRFSRRGVERLRRFDSARRAATFGDGLAGHASLQYDRA